MVIDHTSYAVSDTEGGHTLIASDDFIQSDVILGRKKIEVSSSIEGILFFALQTFTHLYNY